MTYPAYPEYRDSGVEWLGRVPQEWHICRLKFLANLLNGYAFNSNDYVDDGVAIVRIGDVKDNVDWENVKRVPEKQLLILNRFLIMRGDVLLAMTGATIGKTSVWKYDEKALLNQRVGIIRSHILDQEYLSYCAKSESFTKHIELECYGGAQENIGKEDIGDIWLAMPAVEEQTQIATFLDRETQKIDRLIEKQQQLIKLLQEKSQAVISHAVTKGLNPDAKMKDSGVEWLGEIPGHWENKKFSHISMVVRGGSPRPAGDPTLFNGDYSPWVTVAEITSGNEMYLNETNTFLTKKGSEQCRVFKSGTLLLSNSGATLGVPKILNIDANANDGVVGFENLSNDVDIEYAYFYLTTMTDDLRERTKQGAGQPNLNTDIVKNGSS
ncbi:MAG: restriction endonuclease subunit S [Gammaproteobacteria bacterium]|nr:restriction endonuclease subunit S [Gammaproteobacteria bacterium]